MDCWRRGSPPHGLDERYSNAFVAIDAAQTTRPTAWRHQSGANRQGSEGTLAEPIGADLSSEETAFHEKAREIYQRRLELGVAREQARKDLPLCTFTEAYWKIDLHNLLHFLHVRMDPHAQWEIRQYANTIGQEIVSPLFPLVWEALVDYRVEAMQLSRLDQGVIRRLTATGRLPASAEDFQAAQDPSWVGLDRCREREECRAKLVQLGVLRTEQDEGARKKE